MALQAVKHNNFLGKTWGKSLLISLENDQTSKKYINKESSNIGLYKHL